MGLAMARTWSSLLRPPSQGVMTMRAGRVVPGPYQLWADGAMYKRCDGACVCECGQMYGRHPLAAYPLDWNGEPWLNVLCDGTLAKL